MQGQAEVAHLTRRRADKDDTLLHAGLRKFRVLAEKTIAWVYGLGAGIPRHL